MLLWNCLSAGRNQIVRKLSSNLNYSNEKSLLYKENPGLKRQDFSILNQTLIHY